MPSDAPDPRRYWAGMRLGLLGGTFDPPHLGHLAAARAVRDALGLDRVDLVPANDPWQKTDRGTGITPPAVRLEMVRALVKGEDGLGVDDREIRRGGPTYSADTLEEIHAVMPGIDVHLIIGADTARTFDTWRRPEAVLALSTLVVVNRGDETALAPEGAVRVVHVTMVPVETSSSSVRAAVARGLDVSDEVGAAVAQVIGLHGLYAGAA
ncbi:MAG: nicotinate (nicotinamide) nucleotide adenylyltransferase [Acidimicrobiales bacterium]